MQGQHRDLLGLAVRAGQLALPAVVDGDVHAVPLFDDLEPFVDLAAQVGVGQVVGDGAQALRDLNLVLLALFGSRHAPGAKRR